MRVLINKFFFLSANGRLKKKNTVATVATVPLEQTKSIVAFTRSPNKCHNIFTKHLFQLWLVTVSHFIILF